MTTITAAAAAAAAGRGRRRLLDSTARLFQTSTDSSFFLLSQPGSFVLAKAVGSQVIELADEKTVEQ